MVRKILTSTPRSFLFAPNSDCDGITIVIIADELSAVKFEGDTLPPILNALTTDNGGNKLVLEVAVC